MKSFLWDESYLTGLTNVDRQHQHLVDIINNFGNLLVANKIVHQDLENLYNELTEYTQYHFREEEDFMRKIGIDKRHLDAHIKVHKYFIDEVSTMYTDISEDHPDSAKDLINFLSHWLAYHILGVDHNMARQVEAIKSGKTSKEAYDIGEKTQDKATKLLLGAMNSLFEQVSEKNKALVKFNQSLEEKIAQRTKALSEANIHLEELSLTDALTELPNRRHAMRYLASLWNESIKNNSPLVCMMIDADHFKAVNDTHGHDAGDLVLKELSKTLQHSLRNDDIVCRLGGDEFFVICPNTDKDGGIFIAEQIRNAVSELRVPTGGEPWHGSISIGVGYRTNDLNNYEELIKMADKGVYIAKQDGKNCVRTINETSRFVL